ncbi:MAG: hypothetical protein AAF404_06035, partial [Pseudomonadota bacterium]
DKQNLKHVRGLSDGFLKHNADAIVALIRDARNNTPETLQIPARKNRLTPLQDAAIDVLSAVAKSHAETLRINAAVLAPRKSLEELVRGNSDTAVMQGWRGTLIGEPIKQVLDGNRTLAFVDGVLTISPAAPS